MNKDKEDNHSFDKITMLGVFALVIVITGVFGFLYEYIFYFFNGGIKEISCLGLIFMQQAQ